MRKKQKLPKFGIFLVSLSVACMLVIGAWAGSEFVQKPPIESPIIADI